MNIDAWIYCYTIQCCRAPDLYPQEFSAAAKGILNQDLIMEKSDITTDNAKSVYLHLLSKFLKFFMVNKNALP